jgi:hypothetical protein
MKMRGHLAGLVIVGSVLNGLASDDMLVYSEQLNNGWQDCGWVPHHSTNNPVHSGTNSICIAPNGGWQAWWLMHDAINTAIYTNITFWLNGGPIGGQAVGINVTGPANTPRPGFTAPANTWQQIVVSLSSLGAANITNLTGIQIWSNTGNVQSNFFVDDITLVAAPTPSVVHVSLLATQTVRVVDANVFGINQVAWDGNVYTPTSVSIMINLGQTCLRWPGGSWGDGYHWTNEAWSDGATSARNWGSFSTNFIQLATNTHAQAFIICNYGSSDANEAAFGVRMFNITNRCNFKYWEIGNEVGGNWETDNNTNPPWQPHDPWTYAMRFTNYCAQMKAADPTIKIGAVADISEDGTANYTNHPVVNPRTGETHNGWTPVMLTYMRSNNVLPDFLIEHKYPPSDGDIYNLLWSSTWTSDAASLRQMVSDYLGSAGTNVTLESTENGSTGDAQSVSLVGGLLYADSLGQVLQTELNSRLWWDTRNNGPDGGTITNSDPALYGWRTNSSGYFYQDGGIVYNAGMPTNRYPKYYVAKLMSYFAAGGDTVVKAASDYLLLSAYAVKRTNGTMTVLVINKSASSNITAAIQVNGYLPATNATIYSYGIPQDAAAQTGIGSPDIQTNFLTPAEVNFTNTFPPYSASVLVFNPAPPPKLALPNSPPGEFVCQIQGQPGARYVLQTCTNLNSGWMSTSTSVLSGFAQNLTNNISGVQQFWRAAWLP